MDVLKIDGQRFPKKAQKFTFLERMIKASRADDQSNRQSLAMRKI